MADRPAMAAEEQGAGAQFTATARRLGIYSAASIVILGLAYLATLAVGFSSLETPQQPIGDPMFSMLEILIMVMMPPMIALMVAVHAWAPVSAKMLSMTSIVFIGLLAGETSSVHFVILTLSRQAAFANAPWLPQLLSFQWPSVPYVLDILGWDVFFALSMLFAAPVFSGSRLAIAIRVSMTLSGAIALAGLSGIVANDMRLRNIGIVGYALLFPVAAALLAALFYKTEPYGQETAGWLQRGNLSRRGR
jgi:hypothetical protein